MRVEGLGLRAWIAIGSLPLSHLSSIDLGGLWGDQEFQRLRVLGLRGFGDLGVGIERLVLPISSFGISGSGLRD